MNLRNNGIIYTLEKEYKHMFRSNCSIDCPIIYYGLSRDTAGTPLNTFESNTVWKDSDNNFLFNSSIVFDEFDQDSGVTEYQENFTQNGNMTLPLYIVGLTNGMRLFYQPINFNLLNHSYGEYNFPPVIQSEWPIVTILVDPLDPVGYSRVNFNVSDANGDIFSVSITNPFEFTQIGAF